MFIVLCVLLISGEQVHSNRLIQVIREWNVFGLRCVADHRIEWVRLPSTRHSSSIVRLPFGPCPPPSPQLTSLLSSCIASCLHFFYLIPPLFSVFFSVYLTSHKCKMPTHSISLPLALTPSLFTFPITFADTVVRCWIGVSRDPHHPSNYNQSRHK